MRKAIIIITTHLKDVAIPLLFAVSSLTFGLLFLHTAPPLWGVDESTHFSRVYQIYEGGYTADKLSGGGYGGELPETLIRLNQQVVKDLGDNPWPVPTLATRDDADAKELYDQLADRPIEGKLYKWDFTGAAAYSYMAYPGALAGMWLAGDDTDLAGTINAARMGTLVLYVLLASLAVWLIRHRVVVWLFVIVGLLPMAVFQAATMSPDGLLIAATMVLLASVLRLRSEFTSSDKPVKRSWKTYTVLALAAVCSAVIPMIKPTYLPLSLMILGIPAAVWRAKWQSWLYCLLAVAVAVGGLVYWHSMSSDVLEAVGRVYGQAGIDSTQQIKFVFSHPLQFIKAILMTMRDNEDIWIVGVFGRLGWNFVLVPVSVIIMLTAAITAAAAYRGPVARAADRIEKRFGVVCLLVGIFTIMAIIGSFYAGFSPVGGHVVLGVQGRYFIPPLLLVLIGLYAVAPLHVVIKRWVAYGLFAGLSLISLTVALLVYGQAL